MMFWYGAMSIRGSLGFCISYPSVVWCFKEDWGCWKLSILSVTSFYGFSYNEFGLGQFESLKKIFFSQLLNIMCLVVPGSVCMYSKLLNHQLGILETVIHVN